MVFDILGRKADIILRKSFPECELPCRVLIYCDKSKPYIYKHFTGKYHMLNEKDIWCMHNGKIVGEFILNKIEPYGLSFVNIADKRGNTETKVMFLPDKFVDRNYYLSSEYLLKYANGEKILYGWCIDYLDIYKETKTLADLGLKKISLDWQYVKE